MPKILIFSGQATLINLVAEQFSQCQLQITDKLDEAYDLIENTKFDIFITHYQEPANNVIELLNYLHDASFQTKTLIVCQTLPPSLERAHLYQLGVCAIAIEPFLSAEIKQKVEYLLSIVKVYPNQTICAGPVSLNPQTGTLVVADCEPQPLRRRETDILACLLRHRPRVVTKDMLIDYVWGTADQAPTFSTLDVYIRRLRIHLGQFHSLIKTSRGFGYYFTTNN